MRKREREKVAKKLKEIMDPLHRNGVGQLDVAYWYILNNSKQKGQNYVGAALVWIECAQKELKKLMKKELK